MRGCAAILGAVLVILCAAAGIAGLPYMDRRYHIVHVNRAKIVPGAHGTGLGRVYLLRFTINTNQLYKITINNYKLQ